MFNIDIIKIFCRLKIKFSSLTECVSHSDCPQILPYCDFEDNNCKGKIVLVFNYSPLSIKSQINQKFIFFYLQNVDRTLIAFQIYLSVTTLGTKPVKVTKYLEIEYSFLFTYSHDLLIFIECVSDDDCSQNLPHCDKVYNKCIGNTILQISYCT